MQVYFAFDGDKDYRTITLPGCQCTLLQLLQAVPCDPATVGRIEVGTYIEELAVRDDWLSLVRDDEWVIVYRPGQTAILPQAVLATASGTLSVKPPAKFTLGVRLPDCTRFMEFPLGGESRSVLELLAERGINPDEIDYLEIGYDHQKLTRRSLRAKVYDGEYLVIYPKSTSCGKSGNRL